MTPSARAALAAVALGAALAACSEEDRRAWVSILPLPSEEDSLPASGRAGGAIAIAPDSSAVLIGSDTLFTRGRVPGRPPIVEVVASPDSTSIGFVAGADRSAVGVWSRTRQVAAIAEPFPGGGAGSLAWSPDARYLAYRGITEAGVTRSGAFDAVELRPEVHPLLSWFSRQGQATSPQGWIDARRLRLLVAPGRAPEGGLAYSWELEGGALVLESAIAPLAERAPPGSTLERGGVFSLDLLGDGAPETVALYRGSDGAPSALLLETRGTEDRVVASSPLVPPDALGLENWSPVRRGALLFQVAALDGRPTLLLDLPSSAALRAIGLFRATPAGEIHPLTIAEGDGRPAIFYDGVLADVTSQLGLVDLDGDGSLEVVAAVGRQSPSALEPVLEWSVAPFRARGDRLLPAPELEAAARDAVQRALEQG